MGHNEELISKAIGDRRDQVILATKFGNVRGSDDSFLGVNGKPDYVRFKQSLLYYPIKPEAICQTGSIPLHSGAELNRECWSESKGAIFMSEISSSTNGSQVKRQPMKTNVFQHLISHTGVPGITSLFPYLHPGAIVMGGVYHLNYPGSPEYNFHHTNDCEELFIALVSNGVQRAFGMLAVGARTHEVDSHTGPQESNPDAYTVALVIQRNKEKPPQREVFSIYCPNEECKKLVFRKEMDNFEGKEQPYYPEFKTVTVLGPDALDEFNQSDRTCHSCGTVLPHFPVENMSWSLYTRQVRLANRARADYERFLANQSAPKAAALTSNFGAGDNTKEITYER